ncbi:complement component receptor 1-like protein [Hoplias malabaricus]|uniref:complement component receptor 1-like protein n=1 Tax=Hoplias malabaricus TaxID=27720 RepID=UPI00346269F3
MQGVIVSFIFAFLVCSLTSAQEPGCPEPVVKNARILRKSEGRYEPGAHIEYQCLPGYEPERFTITCGWDGQWHSMRYCTEKVCRLESVSYGVESTSPRGKNVFRIGETLTITCSENYWGTLTKQNTQTIKCLDSGEWETPPVCEEIQCDVPMYQHVQNPRYYFSWDRKLGTRVSYYCEDGYKQKATYATCTKNGWTPNPLCEEPGCPEPIVENARILRKSERPYKPGERIEYQC